MEVNGDQKLFVWFFLYYPFKCGFESKNVMIDSDNHGNGSDKNIWYILPE